MQKQNPVKPEPEELVAAEDSANMSESRKEKQTSRRRLPASSFESDLAGGRRILNQVTNGSSPPLAAAAPRLARDTAAVFPLLPPHAAAGHRRVRRSRKERPPGELECAEEGEPQDPSHCGGSGSREAGGGCRRGLLFRSGCGMYIWNLGLPFSNYFGLFVLIVEERISSLG